MTTRSSSRRRCRRDHLPRPSARVGRCSDHPPARRAVLQRLATGILLFLLWDVHARDGDRAGRRGAAHAQSTAGSCLAWFAWLVLAGGFVVGPDEPRLLRRAGSKRQAAARRCSARAPRRSAEFSRPGRRRCRPPPSAGSRCCIATGIGLHNFSEGLAIGQSARAGRDQPRALPVIVGFARTTRPRASASSPRCSARQRADRAGASSLAARRDRRRPDRSSAPLIGHRRGSARALSILRSSRSPPARSSTSMLELAECDLAGTFGLEAARSPVRSLLGLFARLRDRLRARGSTASNPAPLGSGRCAVTPSVYPLVSRPCRRAARSLYGASGRRRQGRGCLGAARALCACAESSSRAWSTAPPDGVDACADRMASRRAAAGARRPRALDRRLLRLDAGRALELVAPRAGASGGRAAPPGDRLGPCRRGGARAR